LGPGPLGLGEEAGAGPLGLGMEAGPGPLGLGMEAGPGPLGLGREVGSWFPGSGEEAGAWTPESEEKDLGPGLLHLKNKGLRRRGLPGTHAVGLRGQCPGLTQQEAPPPLFLAALFNVRHKRVAFPGSRARGLCSHKLDMDPAPLLIILGVAALLPCE
jgi:hypothetical protein